MAATSPRRTTRRSRLLLTAIGVGLLLAAAAVGVALVRGRDKAPPPRTAPVAVLADASDFKGLALTTYDGLWWVSPWDAASKWRHVEVFAASQPAWAGSSLVVAGPGEFVLADGGGELRARVPYPAALADMTVREAPLSAVELPDGRIRVAFAGVVEEGPLAVVLTVAADARSAVASTHPAGAFRGHVALSPDGARVAYIDAHGALVTAPAGGGAPRTVPDTQPVEADAVVIWTPQGITVPLPGAGAVPYVLAVVHPTTGARRAVQLPADVARNGRVIGVAPDLGIAGATAQWWCDFAGADPLRPTCERLALAKTDRGQLAVRTAAGTIVATFNPSSGDELLVQPQPAVGDRRTGAASDNLNASASVAGLSTI